MSHEKSRFERDLKRLPPEGPPHDLRGRVLTRAEEEALGSFALSLRRLRPGGPAADLRARALGKAFRGVALARRERLVRYAAALVVFATIPINLWVEGRSTEDRRESVPTQSQSLVVGWDDPEWMRYERFCALARRLARPSADWAGALHMRREDAWSAFFFKG